MSQSRQITPYGRLVKATIAFPRFVLEEFGTAFRTAVRDAAIEAAKAHRKAREEMALGEPERDPG